MTVFSRSLLLVCSSAAATPRTAIGLALLEEPGLSVRPHLLSARGGAESHFGRSDRVIVFRC